MRTGSRERETLQMASPRLRARGVRFRRSWKLVDFSLAFCAPYKGLIPGSSGAFLRLPLLPEFLMINFLWVDVHIVLIAHL